MKNILINRILIYAESELSYILLKEIDKLCYINLMGVESSAI